MSVLSPMHRWLKAILQDRRGGQILISLFLLSITLWGETGSGPVPPQKLSETGLYSDIASKTVAQENLCFSPQYPLWSDGATKKRWVYLPPGQVIDARDSENWIFPVGTKFWKEFSFGKRVETRVIEKVAQEKWSYQTYAWNTDESEAILVSNYGSRNHIEIAAGVRHDIPGVNDCKVCHEGKGRDVILGFSALQLSPERDSLAPHAEQFDSTMINLNDLIEQGRIAHLSDDLITNPPRIFAKTPRERAALGYVWANCGGCHNAKDPLASVGMELKLPLSKMTSHQDSMLTSVVGHLSKYQIPGVNSEQCFRVKPGEPEHSSLVYRMQTRNPYKQMPPLGTKIVDQEAVDLISEWIRNDLSK